MVTPVQFTEEGIVEIGIGSKNEVKVRAIRETFALYKMFEGAKYVVCDVPSGVSKQPKSLDETCRGAMRRAQRSFGGDYGVGVEGGLMSVPYTEHGVMNVCAASVYDGERYVLGLSSAFEYPPMVYELMRRHGLDQNQAMYQAGLTNNPEIGSAGGAISVLTNGRIDRKEYIKQALIMALIQIDRRAAYAK